MTQNIMKALAATSLTLLVGCATQHQGAQNGREFSFSADFLTYPYEANTSSNVWQYFYRIDMANRTGVYERLPNYSRSIHNGGTEAWGVGNNDPPYIGKHMTADTLFSTRFQVGEMNVHPANDRLGIAIGFQAPEKGLYDLSGSVRPVSGGSINWYLDKGTASDNLKSGLHLRSGRSTFSIPRVRLSAGDFIYLIVDDDGDYTRDWTAVEFIARLTEQSH